MVLGTKVDEVHQSILELSPLGILGIESIESNRTVFPFAQFDLTASVVSLVVTLSARSPLDFRVVGQITVVVGIDVQAGITILRFIEDKSPGLPFYLDPTVVGSFEPLGTLFNTLGFVAHHGSQWTITTHSLGYPRRNERLFDFLTKEETRSYQC